MDRIDTILLIFSIQIKLNLPDMNFISRFTPALLALCVLFSCKKSFDSTTHSAEEIGRYIAAHVPAVIDVNDPVRVRFAVAVDTSKTEGIFDFNPEVEGTYAWEDAMTLSFTPNGGWKPGEKYQVQVSLDKVIKDVDPKMKKLVFDFTVKPVRMMVSFEPLTPEFSGDQASYNLRGRVITSIGIDSNKVREALSIKSSGKMAAPQWFHSEDKRTHEVMISGIAPDASLEMRWDGSSIGAEGKGTRKIEIPKANELSVLSFEPGAEGEKKVSVYFSQKLDPAQDVNGLVTINGITDGFTVRQQDHILSIYPGEGLQGPLKIELHPSITSSRKIALGKTISMEVSLEDSKPAVKLVGTGVITPGSEAVVFPFEAINLRSVQVEVLRIFENNILQYLQQGGFEDQWNLEPVGRVIFQKQIDLEAMSDRTNQYVWTRYALDLGPLVDLAPGSIYQVRIGFKGEDTYLDCIADINVERDPPPYGEMPSFWQYSYYYDGFSWDHNDDPCYPAFYNPEKFISRNILASDIGLTAKQNESGKIWVMANSITSAAAKSGVEIEVFDYQQQSMAKATTGTDGVAAIDIPRKAFFVVATEGNQKGYLRLADGLSLSMSEFDAGGTSYQQGLRGYIYAERDVWRPGDSVFLNFILWDPENKIDARHPVQLTITNPLGQKELERTSAMSLGGIYDLAFATSTTAPTGNWMAKIRVGDAVFTKSLKIETIKPNRLKIDAQLPEAIIATTANQTIPLEAQWLFGAPAANLKAVVEAQYSPNPFSPGGFSDFIFTDPARRTPNTVTVIFDDNLDAQGKASIKIPDVKEYLPEGQLTMAIKTRVFEAGGDFSTDRHSTTFHPYDHYAGVAIPTNRWGYEEMMMNENNDVRLASVNVAGKGVAGRSLSVGVYNAQWRWWWDQSSDDITQYNSQMHLGAIQTDTVVTGKDGVVTYKVKPASWGSYMIRVCDTESGHCTGQFYYAGSWGDPSDASDAASRLYFTTDKEKYSVGEKIKLNIPSAKGSRILLTIEKNNQVLSSKWYEVTADQTQLTVDATPEMMPNAYAFVSHIQPYDHPGNDMPLRMYGVMPLMVEDPKTMLHPEITVADALQPDKDFTITVSEKEKLPMSYTIAVVDEGLLGLTRFQSPDPWKHFHQQEALSMQTWDMFDQVLGGYGGTIERLLSLGGDAAAKLVDAPQAERFKPVVMHLGPYYLEPGQKKTHTLHMPNYVGAVRTMIVASDRKRWGSASKTSTVKSEMMIQSTLPRMVSPGETIAVPVQVFAMADNIRDVNVTVKTNAMGSVSGEGTQVANFTAQGDKMVYFNLKTAERPGLLTVEVTATSGGKTTTQKFELDVRIPNPIRTDVVAATIPAGQKWSGKIPLPGMTGTNEASVEVSQMPPINLEKRLQYLIHYPYGCLEQTISSVFPQLYLAALTDLKPQQEAEIRKNVQAGLMRMKHYSLPSGGFTYWPGENRRDPWTNSYAGHFLIEASKAGFTVDQTMLNAWRNAQKKDAQAYRRGQYYRDDLNQAYRLYTLALDGEPSWGMMNRLRVVKDLDVTAKWMLAAAYALGKRNDVANEIITSLSRDVKPYQELSYTYGSELRDKAIILETFLAMGKNNDAMEIARAVATILSSESWYSTQSTSWGLAVMGRMAKQFATGTLKATITQGGKSPESVSTSKGLVTRDLGVDNDNITIENTSSGPLFVRVTGSGRPLKGVTAPVAKNLSMKAKYMDMQGKVITVDKLKKGTDFIVQIEVTNPGTFTTELDEMAMSYLFPSGWELTNQRLDQFRNRQYTNSYVRYQDFRDDRVNSFFSMDRGTWTYHFVMTATYTGRYWLPDIMCEAMYSNNVQARLPGKWVEVI
jgi:uncharacterized protein YfaS (alpha-2-macroglobulin family)